MWFWTECSDLIGSERLYIPHSQIYGTISSRKLLLVDDQNVTNQKRSFDWHLPIARMRSMRTEHSWAKKLQVNDSS